MAVKIKIVVMAAAALVMTGCTQKALEQYKDAPRATEVDKSPARVLVNPDGFSNVAMKCDGPNMVYVLFKGDAAYGGVAVAPNDPRCRGAG